jgi:ankyrin repeat protein
MPQKSFMRRLAELSHAAALLLALGLWPTGALAVDIPDNPLIDATLKGDVYKMHQATLSGASVNQTDRDFTPALVLAAKGGFYEAVRYLLANGANPNARARDGTTALSHVSFSGRADIAELLLRSKADPDQVGRDQDAPILIATRARNTSIVKLLLQHNVDIEATDLTGRNALDMAQERYYDDIANLLRAAGSPAQ